MSFIAKTDLYTQILQDELNEITRNDDTLIAATIKATIAQMITYLHQNYDVAVIFAKTGDDRDQLLVRIAADITIWHLIARGQPGQNYDDRKWRYDRAITWLKDASKTTNLPGLETPENVVQGGVVFGSNPKRNNYF